MKSVIQIKMFFVISLFCINICAFGQTTDNLIWFDAPAKTFTESLPLGNGRLGAMVFGGENAERIILNESSLWSGSIQDSDKPEAAQYLPEIQRLLREGKNAEAEALVYKHFTAKGDGSARGKSRPCRHRSFHGDGR